MDEFITSYGFTLPAFQSKIIQTNALVTGSAALALYLQENEVDPGFEPNSLDIFVDGEHAGALIAFIQSKGYRVLSQEDIYEEMPQIDLVITFKLEKIMQIIVLQDVPSVLDYIVCNFDLSVNATWWDAAENAFNTLCPTDTLLKEMYLIHTTMQHKQLDKTLSMVQRERLVKYETRGFDLFSPPRPSEAMSIADHRNMEPGCKLIGTTTFDIAAFEEVRTTVFLKQSIQNILIYIGNQFNGYNRQYLIDYIQNRRSWLNEVGYVYKTPSNHLISEHMLHLMKYSDFTVFAYANPFIIEGQELYSMHFYTVSQWSLGTPGIYVSAQEELMSDELPPSSPILQRMDGYESMPDLSDDEVRIVI